MTETVQRMLTLSESKRLPIRLDEHTWQAIDWLADESSQSWVEWCRGVVGANSEDLKNITGTIRSAAMDGLLCATIFSQRAEQLAQNGPIWSGLGMCSDQDFDHALSQADIEGAEDFIGFKLAAGINEFGYVTFYIGNGVKECSNLIISTPFTMQEWSSRV